jgi:hypothetical protein
VLNNLPVDYELQQRMLRHLVLALFQLLSDLWRYGVSHGNLKAQNLFIHLTEDHGIRFVTTDAHVPSYLEMPKHDTVQIGNIIKSFPNQLPLTSVVAYLDDLSSQ